MTDYVRVWPDDNKRIEHFNVYGVYSIYECLKRHGTKIGWPNIQLYWVMIDCQYLNNVAPTKWAKIGPMSQLHRVNVECQCWPIIAMCTLYTVHAVWENSPGGLRG